MNAWSDTLERFTTDYAVPVAETWNGFIHAATTGETDTVAAYVTYAGALRRADDARRNIQENTVSRLTRVHEQHARQISEFETEFIGYRSRINALRAMKHEREAEQISEQIADLNNRINTFAESIGSSTHRAPDDETHLHVLDYTEKPSMSRHAIPPRYGVPRYETFTEALEHIIRQQTINP